MKNKQLILLIIDDLTKIGLIKSKDIIAKLNISKSTWWFGMKKGLISDTTLKKIAHITRRPYSEYKKLKED